MLMLAAPPASRALQEQQQPREQERQRQDFLDPMAAVSRMRVDSLFYPRPYYAVLMEHDGNFDLNSIPLDSWLEQGDKEEIPWSIQTEKSSVRLDQRTEAPYVATIQAKEANKLVGDDLYFIALITNRAGDRLGLPKIVHHVIDVQLPAQAELRFSDFVFVQPGEYTLWLILHDAKTGRRNTVKRRIVVPALDDDPLPSVDKQLQVDFPPLSDPEGGAVIHFTDGLTIPVRNKRPLRIELISVLSPPDQWSKNRDIVRRHNQQTASVLDAFAQMRLGQSAISITGLDLNHRSVPFEQRDIQQLDRQRLVDTLRNLKDQTVSLATLEKGGGSAFLRTSIEGMLERNEDTTRVFIIVSSLSVFDRSSDLDALKLRENSKNHVYYLRFRHNTDAFDDIEKIIKPLGPRTFNLNSGLDFRKALAEIIRDLENL
jgi:hypothetical protein